MNLDTLLPAFEAFPAALRSLTACWPAEEVAHRPAEGQWSVLEVCAHLLDEEREDFRPRMLSTLEDPARPWPAIDPEGWVRTRNYAGLELDQVLEDLKRERAQSAQILRELAEVDWDASHRHSSLGQLSAGGLLCSWMAHDALHLRQLSRLWFRRVVAASSPYSPRYAEPPADWWSL